MAWRRTAARALAVLLVVASAVGAAAEAVVDGFETEALGPLWWLRAEAERVTVQREVVRSGRSALRVEVREGDVAGVGGDAEATERTEIQLAHERWARFGETQQFIEKSYRERKYLR